ncbi:MAG TPA: hypothetical protein VEA69_20015 [Tepidisphaeraceae bacterium]|nr:hypothetical protein [Tepidisphaeraceae bacterium]
MSSWARVDNVDALQAFRQSLVRFAETTGTALADAEAEAQRVLVWLETEAQTYWGGQIRKRHEEVERCKDAVRQKKLFKSPTGSTQSAVEEEKLLKMAQRRLEEAEQKLKNVRRYGPKLQKELSNYKGGVQRLSTGVSSDVPLAVARLDKMIAAVRAYAGLTISSTGTIAESTEAAKAMARAAATLASLGTKDYSPLRKKTKAVERAGAPAADLRLESWSDGLISDRERPLVAKIEAARTIPGPGALVVVEKDVWKSERVYMERGLPGEGAADDSGWFFGTTESEPDEDGKVAPPNRVGVTVAHLTEARPDLVEVLALPRGYLAIVGSTGVDVVLDERGVDVWSGFLEKSG